jgi:hypothetical protein
VRAKTGHHAARARATGHSKGGQHVAGA